MGTKTKLVTYDDYQHLPDDRNRYEIIGGELFMTPAPSTDHQNIVGNIHYHIRHYLEEHDVGKVFISPSDVVLSMTDVVEPDLFFIINERSEIITTKNIVAAPDLVVEILSESTAKIDRHNKKLLYEKNGVREYWIVDPEEKQIEQYILQEDKFKIKKALQESEVIFSEVIKDFDLQLEKVFAS